MLSLTVALTPSIRAPLVAPFLCPVLAMLVCGPSVGASVRTGWQVIKGAVYAAAFGFTTYRTRGGRGNTEGGQVDEDTRTVRASAG